MARYWNVDANYVLALMPNIDISEDSLINNATLSIIIDKVTSELEFELITAIGLDNLVGIYNSGPDNEAYKKVQSFIFDYAAPRIVMAARTYSQDTEALRNAANDVLRSIRTNPQGLGYVEQGDGSFELEFAERTVTSTSAPSQRASKYSGREYF